MPPKRKRPAKATNDAESPPKKVTAISKDTPKAAAGGKFSLAELLTEPGWSKAMQSEMKKGYFKSLETALSTDYDSSSLQIFPPQHLIFNAFHLTPLDQVKVVILGQDPYHDDDQAHGLCFSVPKGIKVPPSLKNMYKELEDDIPEFNIPDHGCLESWAKDGVLLLNASLTVEAHKPNSHKSYGWQKFTDEVIRVISAHCNKVVFLLWGGFAHKKEKLIDVKKHVVLKDAHPSSLSFGKFHHCKCFSRANDALKKAGLKSVDWTL